MSGSERQKAAKLLSRPGGWPRREGSTLWGRREMETVLRREKSASRYSVMGAPREGGVGVLLELHRDLAEGEIRLQREHHVAVVVGQPHARVGPLREDAAAVGDPRADDDRAPFLARDAHPLASQHLDDYGVAFRAEVPVVLVALADLERNGAGFLCWSRAVPLEIGKRYEYDRYFRPERNPV